MSWACGDHFLSYSGESLDPLNPRASQIHLKDIANNLSMLCRFGGAVRTFYSVADHSVYVSRLVPPELAVAGLLHDAAEAYLGDMIKPLKRHCRDYQRLEFLWERIIERRFWLAEGAFEHPLVKRADVQALLAERRDLLTTAKVEPGPGGVDALTAAEPVCQAHGRPSVARELFMARAQELGL